jgi:hypothetical protein
MLLAFQTLQPKVLVLRQGYGRQATPPSAVTRQPCHRHPHSRDGIRNEPAKKRDLSGSVGAMTATPAGSGKLKVG